MTHIITHISGSIVVLLVSLLIGGLGIYIGGLLITGKTDYKSAVITAVLGSITWTITGFFLGWIPFLGPIITLFAYIWIIKQRYPGGWINAAGITLVAWISSLLILYILATAEITSFRSIGVPGV